MLINVTHDREFQKYLDHMEQRLQVHMMPLLLNGIRIQLRNGGVPAHDVMVKRGKKLLIAHYKRIFRHVYSTVEPIEKADSRGVNTFMDRMTDHLESEGASKIQNISQTLMDNIREKITTGVREGRSNQQITRDILAEAPDFSRNRAATIARTETHGAAMWAMDETIDDKEIEVQKKTWWTAGDGRVRPSHAAMHGVEIARDEMFELEGGSMAYPGDDSQGADEGEIINCRCSVLYSTEPLATEPAKPETPIDLDEIPTSPISDTFRDELITAMDKIPDKAIERMDEANVTIGAGRMFTDILPSVRGVQPRGWPEGSTWDNAGAGYFRGDNRIVLAEYYKSLKDGGLKRTERAEGSLLHESGHAFDDALAKTTGGGLPASLSAGFKLRYDQDKETIPDLMRDALGYLLQSGNAGQEETFAELFASIARDGAGSSFYDPRKYFPKTARWVKNVMEAGVYPR